MIKIIEKISADLLFFIIAFNLIYKLILIRRIKA